MCLEIIYLIHMYKKNLGLNNLQWLMCHKTKPNQTAYDSEAPVLEILGVGSVTISSLLPLSLWSGMVVPVRVPSKGFIDI